MKKVKFEDKGSFDIDSIADLGSIILLLYHVLSWGIYDIGYKLLASLGNLFCGGLISKIAQDRIQQSGNWSFSKFLVPPPFPN